MVQRAVNPGNGIAPLAFRERVACECCGSEDLEIVLERIFTDPSVLEFIESYYEGRISKEKLEGTKYFVAKCARCTFLFQKHILNSSEMRFLYETAIKPEQSLTKRENPVSRRRPRFFPERGSLLPSCSRLRHGMRWSPRIGQL